VPWPAPCVLESIVRLLFQAAQHNLLQVDGDLRAQLARRHTRFVGDLRRQDGRAGALKGNFPSGTRKGRCQRPDVGALVDALRIEPLLRRDI